MNTAEEIYVCFRSCEVLFYLHLEIWRRYPCGICFFKKSSIRASLSNLFSPIFHDCHNCVSVFTAGIQGTFIHLTSIYGVSTKCCGGTEMNTADQARMELAFQWARETTRKQVNT